MTLNLTNVWNRTMATASFTRLSPKTKLYNALGTEMSAHAKKKNKNNKGQYQGNPAQYRVTFHEMTIITTNNMAQ